MVSVGPPTRPSPQVAPVGLGNLGTAARNFAANDGSDVSDWEYYSRVVEEINREDTNSGFLSGVRLSQRLTATDQLLDVVDRAHIISVAIPSAYVISTLEPIAAQGRG